MPRSSNQHFCMFFDQNSLHISCCSHTCYILHPSHSPGFDHPSNIVWVVWIVGHLLCNVLQIAVKFLPQVPIFFMTLFFSAVWIVPVCVRPKFHTCVLPLDNINTLKPNFIYIYIYYFSVLGKNFCIYASYI